MTKKKKKVEPYGIIYIQSTFNNTIVTLTDLSGNTILWSSCGKVGFKGTKKGTAYAASICAQRLAGDAIKIGIKKAIICLKGPGPGRDTAIRSIKSSGISITEIRDITPLPHDGCRPPKPRRV